MRYRNTSLIFVVCILSLIGSAALSAQEPFTPHHVAKLRIVTAAAISPGGESVAYVLSVPRKPLEEDDGPAWTELHLVDASGQSRPFITGKVNIGNIAWSPDGTRVSFLAKREGDEHRSLYVIRAKGGESEKLVELETAIRGYSWSSDGNQVALLATEPVPEKVETLKEKGFDQVVFEEDWQPVRVWIMDVGDEEAKPRKLDLEGSASSLHWSPVDSRLVTALAPTSLVDDSYMNRKLHIVDAVTGELIARFENPGKLGQVAWSPDGNHLAMVSAADPNDPAQGRLMVVPASGGPLKDLMPSYDEGHVRAVAWRSPERLMFLTHEGVESFFSAVNVDGSELDRIVPTGGDVLTGFSLSSDGSAAAFLGESPQHPREVYFMAHGDESPRRLTNSNPWLADMAMARQEVVRFKARDGLELEGLLIHPLNEKEGAAYPLILTVHGGPESHHSNGWVTSYSLPGQVGAAQEFAVFYTNYRGSTGRGVRFSKMGHADAAGKEFEDLIDAVDHLIEIGLVDRNKVGITGGSYGGYASAWAATFFSERFAASVMYAGITDNVSKMGTTDIPYEMYMVHHRKWVWDDWDYFRKRSPIYYATKGRTPLLIAHGDADTRVHPSQSMEIYRQIKLLGKAPVRMVLYPGEPHGNRRAASRLDYNLRLMRWMEHYLKGPGGDPPPYSLEYETKLQTTN